MSKNKFFSDMIEALLEVEEHMKGNIKLKSNIIEVPDEELSDNARLYCKFETLSQDNKLKVIKFVDDLLQNEPIQA